MFIKAILEVDEDKLEEMNSSFETEMGWVEESGIYLQSYEEVDITDLLSERSAQLCRIGVIQTLQLITRAKQK